MLGGRSPPARYRWRLSPIIGKLPSSAGDRKISSICGRQIARYTLELGGKSTTVILGDYDIETATQVIAGPACAMAGQICHSMTVLSSSASGSINLVDATSTKCGTNRLGNPFEPTSRLGQVAMRRQCDRIEGLIAKGKEKVATFAFGGGRQALFDYQASGFRHG